MSADANQQNRQFFLEQEFTRLLAEQGNKKPINAPDDYGQNIWPEDESIDDFLAWLRQARNEDV